MKAFYDAGCRYLQFDDTVWAYLCSEKELAQSRERGDKTDDLQQKYRDMINLALKDKPADMVITMHACRGNFRSTFIASGGYEPVAEVLLGQVNFDGYFLEYDTDRAGGFEPLRFLPKGDKQVVLGLITSKSGTLEKKDEVKRRIDEAAKFAPARAILPVAAMRLRLDRRGQYPHRGPAMGQDAGNRRIVRGGVGQVNWL